MWCWHEWKEKNRHYSPPTLPSECEFKGTHQDTLLKVLHGFTVIELRCENCGDLKSHTLNGNCPR